MEETFCILYRLHASPSSRRLSRSYDSLDGAIAAAADLAQTSAELLQIRGSDGTIVEKAALQQALAGSLAAAE